MALEYLQDDARHRVVVQTGVQVTADEVIRILDRQAAGGAWAYDVLYDARDALSVPSLDDLVKVVRHIGKLTTRHGPRGPVAIVTTQAGLTKMAAVYAQLGELTSLRACACTTFDEAEQWLCAQEAAEHKKP
jgi:hypothetical protein